MRIKFGFGTGFQTVDIPERNLAKILLAGKAAEGQTGKAEVERALDNPIGAPLLEHSVFPGEKIAVITSDITRPCPSWEILPCLLDRLYRAGIQKKDIILVFALGSHRHHTLEEMRHLAGEQAWEEIRCVDSDPDDCVSLGTTSRGTPVDITRIVAEADRRICLGNIEYHYFAGYSGGAKAIMPGVSTRAAIQRNHSMMVQPQAKAGILRRNPVREDIEEAGDICGIDYIVNVVLDEHKKIIHAVAGDVTAAHREGCRFLDSIYGCKIGRPADIVIAAQGGAPKDLNLYQTQKALDNAALAVKPGGIIILIGSCREGFGEAVFGQWMSEAKSPADLTKRLKQQFQLGGHKAAAIAETLKKAEIFLVSELDPALVRSCFMIPFSNAQEALEEALRRLGREATVLAMPYGGSTLPKLP